MRLFNHVKLWEPTSSLLLRSKSVADASALPANTLIRIFLKPGRTILMNHAQSGRRISSSTLSYHLQPFVPLPPTSPRAESPDLWLALEPKQGLWHLKIAQRREPTLTLPYLCPNNHRCIARRGHGFRGAPSLLISRLRLTSTLDSIRASTSSTGARFQHKPHWPFQHHLSVGVLHPSCAPSLQGSGRRGLGGGEVLQEISASSNPT